MTDAILSLYVLINTIYAIELMTRHTRGDSGRPCQPKHYVHECGRMYFVNELKEPIQCGRCGEIIDICKSKKKPWYRKLWSKKTEYQELSNLEGKKDS